MVTAGLQRRSGNTRVGNLTAHSEVLRQACIRAGKKNPGRHTADGRTPEGAACFF